MPKGLAAAAFFALLVLLSLAAACDGGDEGGPVPTTATATAAGTATGTTTTAVAAIDIKDFDTARFTTTQTSTTSGNTSELSGEGDVDNRKQALSLTYEGDAGGTIIAIGRTIYSYDESGQRWTSIEEPVDGQVGFGRPYWPQFWLDAVQSEELGGRSLQGGDTTGYRLTFDRQKVAERLGVTEVGQAEVEVWVDEDSRYAAQLTFRLELDLGGGSTKLEIVSTFSDFDTEVEIEAPAEVATPTPAQG